MPATAGTAAACGHDRRTFLKGVGLATAAGTAATAGLAPPGGRGRGHRPGLHRAPHRPLPLPQVTLGGHKVPRMILGCNPIGGWAHSGPEPVADDAAVLHRGRHQRLPAATAEKWGLNTWLTYWGKKPLGAPCGGAGRDGSKMRVYFLARLDKDGNIGGAESKRGGDITDYKPLFLVHHGGVTDSLFRAGKQERVHDFVKKAHDMGYPAGVSAHNPEVFKYIEDKGWECRPLPVLPLLRHPAARRRSGRSSGPPCSASPSSRRTGTTCWR